jgi:hypothetical protein
LRDNESPDLFPTPSAPGSEPFDLRSLGGGDDNHLIHFSVIAESSQQGGIDDDDRFRIPPADLLQATIDLFLDPGMENPVENFPLLWIGEDSGCQPLPMNGFIFFDNLFPEEGD